MGMILFKKQ